MFEKVTSSEQIAQTARLAHEIWTQHYSPFLPKGQVPYMLEKFQSANAIKEQIANNHQYFLISANPVGVSKNIGYLDFYHKGDLVFISKIYIKLESRGTGMGAAALNFISECAKEMGVNKLQLTVNKYNAGAIKAYEKNGFVHVKSVVMDIGNGFVMDDFVMEKTLERGQKK